MSGRVNTRPGTNKGFKNPRRPQPVNPRVRRLETPGRWRAGAPIVKPIKTPRILGIWPLPPPEWTYSVGEWIVYWYLTEEKKYVEGRDFYHQSFAYVPYLFQSRNRTNTDFLIPYGPGTKLGMDLRYKALILDPYADFTHSRSFDLKRRNALNDEGYRIVFLNQRQLERDTKKVMEAALKGRDLSDRGRPHGF